MYKLHSELPGSFAVPGKFHGPRGHNKRNGLQDRPNAQSYPARKVVQIALLFKT